MIINLKKSPKDLVNYIINQFANYVLNSGINIAYE